ncbi:MAG TPA: hypothetical protein VK359_05000, partial [Rubrobacteraceae bacterium]|nr:hypothetical protein [Rubrobacteraceae bacterium]
EWQDKRLTEETPLSLSVNLSARQFRYSSLYKEISDILQSTGLEAGTLILEITETVMGRETNAG